MSIPILRRPSALHLPDWGTAIHLPAWLSLSLVVYSLPVGVSSVGWMDYWWSSLPTAVIPRKCYSYFSRLLATASASQSIYLSMWREISCLCHWCPLSSSGWILNFLHWNWPCDLGRLGQSEHLIAPGHGHWFRASLRPMKCEEIFCWRITRKELTCFSSGAKEEALFSQWTA